MKQKLAESEEDLLEHRTDGSDALSQIVLFLLAFDDFQFDTLFIGCEKFPFHDSFTLSMRGIS